jgi:hypothetical protein
MLGQCFGQGQVFSRSSRAKDGMGKLAVTLVAARRDLQVEAAAAGLWVG